MITPNLLSDIEHAKHRFCFLVTMLESKMELLCEDIIFYIDGFRFNYDEDWKSQNIQRIKNWGIHQLDMLYRKVVLMYEERILDLFKGISFDCYIDTSSRNLNLLFSIRNDTYLKKKSLKKNTSKIKISLRMFW